MRLEGYSQRLSCAPFTATTLSGSGGTHSVNPSRWS